MALRFKETKSTGKYNPVQATHKKRGCKGSPRLDQKRIKRFPQWQDLSKTEVEMPEYMKKQRLPPETIAELERKLEEWKNNNTKNHQQ